jgi:abequosyltransferase
MPEAVPTISVCIPVFNFAEFLHQTLESVVHQLGPGDELVIYDGGSTDSTPALMARYAQDPRINYFRAAQRGGIDADLASCVGLATCDFCWLFSGDDLMRPGAIESVRGHLRHGSDILLCEHSLCDKQMRFLRDYPFMLSNAPIRADWSNPAQRRHWLAAARNTEAVFSFLSGIVVRRATWNSGNLPEAFERSCWGHVARFFELARCRLVVEYLPHVYLDKRGGNDSFLGNSAVARVKLAIDGYTSLAATFFGTGSEEARQIRRLLRREHGLKMFLFLKLSCVESPDREDRADLDRMAKLLHPQGVADRMWVAAYELAPTWILRIARSSVRNLRRVFGGTPGAGAQAGR